MLLLSDGAFPLLAMVLLNYACVEPALLRRSSAVDFLKRAQEKRSVRCFPGGCSAEDSETEEVLEVNSDYEESLTQLNFGSKSGQNSSPDSEAAMEDGSGM